MKRGIQMLVLLFVLVAFSNCKKAKRDLLYNKNYIKEIKAARKDIHFSLASNFIPGATVAVAKDGELIYSEGFGYASKDLEVQVKRNTKFRIGNLSELFTNVIYQKLVEEGTLHPDSAVSYYYPTFPKKEHTVTLFHLVQHTSGIRQPNNKEAAARGLNVSLEKGLKDVLKDPLMTAPGLYQNENIFNYNLLGVVMEKATKKNFKNLLKEYLTDTLHLENTEIDNPFITIKNRSNFFDQNFIAQVVNATVYDLRHRAPSQGILSNAEDLAKLGMMFLDSDYLSKQTRGELFKPVPLYNQAPSRMVNGWMLLHDRTGNEFYGKIGNVKGGSSGLLIYPEHKLVIAFASNVTGSNDEGQVFKVAQHFLPDTKNEKKEAKDQ